MQRFSSKIFIFAYNIGLPIDKAPLCDFCRVRDQWYAEQNTVASVGP